MASAPQEIVVHVKVSVEPHDNGQDSGVPWEQQASAFIASLDSEAVEVASLDAANLHMGRTKAILHVLSGWLAGTVNIDGSPR